MFPVKQSTSLAITFFAFDSNGDGVTGKVDGDWTKRISKNGGAFAAMTVTVSEMENGWYSLTLSSSHTDTLGILSLSFSATGIKRVNVQYRVHVREYDDLAFPTTSGRSLDVTTTGAAGIDWGNIENPTTAQNLSATNIDVDQVVASVSGAVGSVTGAVGSVAAGGITAASIATGAVDADALAGDAVAEIAAGVWDEDATGHQTQGTFGQVLGDSGADADSVWSLANTNLDAAVSTRLAPTVAGRTLDVTATGEAGLDLDNTAGTLAKGTEITGFNDLDAAGIRAAVGLAAANLDTQLDTVPTATENADVLLARDLGSGSGAGTLDERTVRSALRFNRNKFTIAGSVLTVYKEDDTTVAFTAAITTTAGNPVSASDPT